MTLRSVQSRSKRKPIDVFDYSDEDDRVEEESKKLLRKFDSPVTKKHHCAIDKYEFLRCFAKDTQSESKVLQHIVIDVEDASVCGRIEITNYGLCSPSKRRTVKM
jgi:sentrin-specific protease 7